MRHSWEDGALALYGSSRKELMLGSFDLAGASVAELAQLHELHLTLLSGTTLRMYVPGSEKSLRKWITEVGELLSSGSSAVAAAAGGASQQPLGVDGGELSKERKLCFAVEEMAFFKSLAAVCLQSAEKTREKSELLDKRCRDLRYDLEHRKKSSVGSPVPYAKPQRVHHQGASVEQLIEALRAKNASAQTTAKHLYSVLGHRPHEEEAANAVLTPGTTSLINSLPKVSAMQQLDELVSFVSKNDPYALQVVQEYASLFLRMRGLDVDLALRRLLYHFKLPKESQQISRVIRAFAECYVGMHQSLQNHDHTSSAFPVQPDQQRHYGPGEFISWTDAESVEIIVFALVMLNGDLHNPENTEKMTQKQFIDNITRSGATVVCSPAALSDWYVRIRDDPIVFDNRTVLYPDAVRKSHLEVKVSGVAGLRMYTRVWAVLCENYDVTAVHDDDRSARSGGYGLLYLCRSSRDESSVYLTFPLRRTVVLEATGKREFSLSQPNATSSTTASSSSSSSSSLSSATIRKKGADETKIKFRCKTDAEYDLWMASLHYLLSGGYGFWYPWEIRDDQVEDIGTTEVKKHRRRHKKGTLKKKKHITKPAVEEGGGTDVHQEESTSELLGLEGEEITRHLNFDPNPLM